MGFAGDIREALRTGQTSVRANAVPTREKVVLVFHSSVRSSWSETLAGIYRFARPQGWNVQVIEHEPNRKSIVELLAFWHPSGVIVEGVSLREWRRNKAE